MDVLKLVNYIRNNRYFDTIVCLILLSSVSIIWSAQIEKYVIEPDRWDEIWQVSRGFLPLKEFFFDAQSSPLLGLWFKIFALFSDDRLAIYYAHLRTIATLLPVALYLFCRSFNLSHFSSVTAGLILCYFPLLTTASRQVTHLAALVFFIGGSIAFSRKTILAKFSILSLTLFAVTLVRPEFQLSLLAVNGTLLFLLIRDYIRSPIRPGLIGAYLTPLLLQILYVSQRNTQEFQKAIFVYRDYAFRRYQEKGLIGSKYELLSRFYGEVDDHKSRFLEVLMRNPGDVLDHLKYGSESVTKWLMITLGSFRYLFETAFGILFVIALVLSCIFLRQSGRSSLGIRLPLASILLIAVPTILSGVLFGVNTRYFIGLVAVMIFSLALVLNRFNFRPWAYLPLLLVSLAGSLTILPDYNAFSYIGPLYGPDNGCCNKPTGTFEMVKGLKTIPYDILVTVSRNNTFRLLPQIFNEDPCGSGPLCPPEEADRQGTVSDYMKRLKIDLIRFDEDFYYAHREYNSGRSTPFLESIIQAIKQDGGQVTALRIECFRTYLLFPKNHKLASEFKRAFPRKDCPGL